MGMIKSVEMRNRIVLAFVIAVCLAATVRSLGIIWLQLKNKWSCFFLIAVNLKLMIVSVGVEEFKLIAIWIEVINLESMLPVEAADGN